MTSSRERQQRATARARLARQMAERQAAARRRRQRIIAASAAAGLVLVVAGGFWIVSAVTGDEPDPAAVTGTPTPTGTAGAGECVWQPEDTSANPNLLEVGTPPAGEPRSGTSTITITTNHGVIEAEMDLAAVPCTAASFAHLAGQGFYDGSPCHRLVTEGIQVLQCGDPTGTGQGGPTYKFAEENLPVDQDPPYPPGTIAMAKTQAPSTTGSQFFIVYGESELAPDYTVVGTVTQGLDIVEDIAAGGNAEDGVAPATEVIIESLTVRNPA